MKFAKNILLIIALAASVSVYAQDIDNDIEEDSLQVRSQQTIAHVAGKHQQLSQSFDNAIVNNDLRAALVSLKGLIDLQTGIQLAFFKYGGFYFCNASERKELSPLEQLNDEYIDQNFGINPPVVSGY